MEAVRLATEDDIPALAELARAAIAELAETKGGEMWVRTAARPEPVDESLRAAIADPDQLLDLFVFAPLGFAMEARKMLPDMIEKGRQQVTGQVGMARVIGKFAVQQGQVEANKAFATAQKQAAGVLENLGAGGNSRRPDPRRTEPPENRPPATASAAAATPSTPASPQPVPISSSVEVATLAIPDYDSLSASQVVPRLAGLSTEELEAVRDYEAGHRGRKTILNKVTQLQGA